MTWLFWLVVGFRRMGFIRAEGASPAASAWDTWARPISCPSGVTKEFRDMFCDLKGATENPWFLKMRQRAVTIRLLPAEEAVPTTIRFLALIFSP